ncbi:MAG TPA: hypothetical protein PLT14_12315, partial [Oscillospiraceae bacterium]|nr:hypothetical protein [Oscillospiraceae bacterium]
SLPDVALLPGIAEFFGVTVDYLFFGPRESVAEIDVPFTDDGILRVVQFIGRKMITKNVFEKNRDLRESFIPLAIDKIYKNEPVSIEIWGSAKIDGDIGGYVEARDSVNCGNIGGYVKAGDGVNCGNVGGYVEAGDSVNCGSVGARVQAGDCVNCGPVGTRVEAGDSVRCGPVGGNVSAGDSVNCGDVNGNVECDGDIYCGEIKGDAHCEGDIHIEKSEKSFLS